MADDGEIRVPDADAPIVFSATQTVSEFMRSDAHVRLIAGPIGCLAGDTLIVTDAGPRRIDALDRPTRVLSWDETLGRFRFVLASAAAPKGTDALYRVLTQHGEWRAAGHHRVLCEDGMYRPVRSLAPGQFLPQYSSSLLQTTPVFAGMLHEDAPRLSRRHAGFLGRCGSLFRRYGQRLLRGVVFGLSSSLRPLGVPALGSVFCSASHTRPGQQSYRPPTQGFALSVVRHALAAEGLVGTRFSERALRLGRSVQRFLASTVFHQTTQRRGVRSQSYVYSLPESAILSVLREETQEVYWDLQVPDTNNYVTVDGAIHHNSGKSVSCVHELMRLAQCQEPNRRGERLTRFLIVRNTADQLRSTTLKTIKDWFPAIEPVGRWVATERTLHYQFGLPDGTLVKTEWMLRALDDEADIRNALSLEVTSMWANECREMNPKVFVALLDRTNRYPSRKLGCLPTRAGAICDTNMPGMETFWEERMSRPPQGWSVHIQPPAVLSLEDWIEKYGAEPNPILVAETTFGKTYVVDPNADNVLNLALNYYPSSVRNGTPDNIDVYLRCQFGRTLSGLPVYDRTFDYYKHVSKTSLTPIRSESYPIWIGLDLGRTPAATIGQMTPKGRIVVLSELVSQNMGIQTFLMTKLKPHLAQKYPGMPVCVAPDPAGWQKSQVNEKCPVDYLKEAGFQIVKPYTNKPKMRIEAVERVLASSIDAEPGFIIDPSCKELIKAFRGGYKWATNKQGELANDSEPLKNDSSHIAEACQYFVMCVDRGLVKAKNNAARTVKVANFRGWA